MKVCMFVLDNCKYDARVLKEARTLADAGHDVRIIAVLDKDTEPYEERDGFKIIRVTRKRIPYRVPQAIIKADSFVIGLIFQLPRWAYHLIKRRFAPSFRKVEQPYILARPKTEQLMGVTYSNVRRSVYGIRRSLYRVVRTALWVFNGPLALGAYYRIWKAVKHEPADIYHCHDLPTLPIGYMAKRWIGGKLVYDTHELFTELHYVPRVVRPIFRFLERRLIHHADEVITVNEFASEELSKRYGVGLPYVIRNCPPVASQRDEQYNGSLRESLGLDDTVPIIVHLGIFSKSRGSEELVSATPFLNHGVIVFLGWSVEESDLEGSNLEEIVRRSGLGDKVLFAPPVAPDQVVGYISSAQVGVVPFLNVSLNHYYATPNKLWECMNAGLPIVSSNFPALKAIVEGYRLGCTYDPEYTRDLANAINYVLSDECRYEEMKKNALEAAKIFNWENESKKLLEVYRRLSKSADDRTA